MAQLFYGMGTTGLFICAAASFLYTINKYRSVTGNIMVAGFLLPSGMSLLLLVLDVSWKTAEIVKSLMLERRIVIYSLFHKHFTPFQNQTYTKNKRRMLLNWLFHDNVAYLLKHWLKLEMLI